MKRYLLFAYSNYYPCGGWHDYQDCSDSLEELQKIPKSLNSCYDYFEIVDLQLMSVVWGQTKRG